MLAIGLYRAALGTGRYCGQNEKAYPVYDQAREGYVTILQNYLDGLVNLQTIGRYVQHRYNNMDHSTLTGLYAARNVVRERHNVWAVNVDNEYYEEVTSDGGRTVFADVTTEVREEDMLLADAFIGLTRKRDV